MLVAAFNDIEMVESLIKEHKDELAGVIVEPFQRLHSAAARLPAGAAQDHGQEHGIPLIFDEVVTGFRFAYGGAQEYYGVTPDLCTLGKIVGGGFALAADRRPRRHHGAIRPHPAMATRISCSRSARFPGNPVASVAGLATLEVLRHPAPMSRSSPPAGS